MNEQGQHGISWCTETWNPLRGCTRVSRGCERCYAERIAARFSGASRNLVDGEHLLNCQGDLLHVEVGETNDHTAPFYGVACETSSGPRWTGRVELIESKLTEPLSKRKPATIFVNSMSDTFHEKVPDEWLDRMFAVMALCPQHRFIVLTKRSRRMREYWSDLPGRLQYIFRVALEMGKLPGSLVYGSFGIEGPRPLPNLILGVSVEDRKHLDRLDDLRGTPAACRMMSAEPLLEDLGKVNLDGISWVIAGVESGPGARNKEGFMDHARNLKDQCVDAGVPFFLKQGWIDGKLVKMPLLDGKMWDQRPELLR